MSDHYTGEIRLFAGNFAPQGWFFCNGQELQVNSYQALYAVLGNQFGGNQMQTFMLPDLRDKAPIHRGAGNGLTPRNFASKGGTDTVTLDTTQLPNHEHPAYSVSAATTGEPGQHIWANNDPSADNVSYGTVINSTMNPLALGTSGASKPHTNMQPYVGVNYIICFDGEFPVPD